MSLKLVLGCGSRVKSDYLNLDIGTGNFSKGIDFKQMDCRDLSSFDDNSVDKIYSAEFLEHLSPYDGLLQFGQYHRILKDSGEIDITVPDFNTAVNRYNGNPDAIEIFTNFYNAICGGQNPPCLGGEHRSIYTKTLFKKVCDRYGFIIDKLETENNVCLHLIARKKKRADLYKFNSSVEWINEISLSHNDNYRLDYIEYNRPTYSYDLSTLYRFIMIIKKGDGKYPVAFMMLPYKSKPYSLGVTSLDIYPVGDDTWGKCIIDFRKVPTARYYMVGEETGKLKAENIK